MIRSGDAETSVVSALKVAWIHVWLGEQACLRAREDAAVSYFRFARSLAADLEVSGASEIAGAELSRLIAAIPDAEPCAGSSLQPK